MGCGGRGAGYEVWRVGVCQHRTHTRTRLSYWAYARSTRKRTVWPGPPTSENMACKGKVRWMSRSIVSSTSMSSARVTGRLDREACKPAHNKHHAPRTTHHSENEKQFGLQEHRARASPLTQSAMFARKIRIHSKPTSKPTSAHRHRHSHSRFATCELRLAAERIRQQHPRTAPHRVGNALAATVLELLGVLASKSADKKKKHGKLAWGCRRTRTIRNALTHPSD